MSKSKWYTRALYAVVALAMTLGLMLAPAVIVADEPVADDPVAFDQASGNYSYIYPDIAKDVKGSPQKFTVYNSSNHEEEEGAFNWTVTQKLGDGVVDIIDGGNGFNFIVIRSLEPGDATVEAMNVTTNITATPGEKKWGWIDHTILDLDISSDEKNTDGADVDIEDAQTDVENPVGDNPEFSDYVYARFYQEPYPGTFVDEAGHAVVHWWLITDDKDGYNEALIDEIMADLGPCPSGGTTPCGCGNYADWPDDDNPFDRIQAVYESDPADFTSFTGMTQGIEDADADPAIDQAETALSFAAKGIPAFNVPFDDNNTRIVTMTEDDMEGQVRGLTQVQASNSGKEDILVVTLVEYPWNYFGENPVCIEKGEKQFTEVGAEGLGGFTGWLDWWTD
jgi:hypothetical protein